MVEVSKVFQQPKFQSLCHDLLFHCRFLFVFFFVIFKQTVKLIIYSFLCFTAWSIYVWLSGRSFQYFGNKQAMWKYTLFLSTLSTRQDNFTFFSVPMIEYLVATSYELWMIKYILYFVALMTIAVEITVEKSSICVWQKSHLKTMLFILSWEIF